MDSYAGRSQKVNMQDFSPLLKRIWIRQIKYKAIMSKEGSAKIVNFITIGARVLMLGRGYKSQYSEYA